MRADLPSPDQSAAARGSANAEAEPRTACNGRSGLVGAGGVDREGRWRVEYIECIRGANPVIHDKGAWAPATMEFDVYPLEPVGGRLCVWAEEIGMFLDGPSQVWDSDEWLGHLPVILLPFDACAPAKYTFLGGGGAEHGERNGAQQGGVSSPNQ